jgi:hypothetical protein
MEFSSIGPRSIAADQNSYYVIRQFQSLEERQRSEDAYYTSDDWQEGPRSRILGLLDHFAYAVISDKTLTAISSPSVLLV